MMNQNAIRKAAVYYHQDLAGILTESKDGYVFQYDEAFLKKNVSVSLSLPARPEPYRSAELFPFFKGLLPEGWYLGIVSATQKVDSTNFFELLSTSAGVGTIGAVTVRTIDSTDL